MVQNNISIEVKGYERVKDGTYGRITQTAPKIKMSLSDVRTASRTPERFIKASSGSASPGACSNI